jgi:hypothetical protein
MSIMRKYIFFRLSLLILFIPLLSGCLKDKTFHTYSYFEPVYRTTAEVRANIKSNPVRDVLQPGKIFIRGQYIFLNEIDKGIHIIDNGNPSSPKKIAFVDIPGNMDMAVKGNTLYADAYTDLVVIDISNPLQVGLKKVIEDVFPFRFYNGYFLQDTSKVLVDWKRKDTTVEESFSGGGFWRGRMQEDVVFMSASNGTKSASSGSGTPFGLGGSMARFSIVQNHLYTVTTSHLNVFQIADALNPVFTKDISLGWNIETIYPFRDQLFVGSMNGMFIFSIANPNEPIQTGQFEHARSCDPVIADDQFAYVTLRSGTACEGFNNQLDVVDLRNPSTPFLSKTYSMTNPHGLSKDGNILFICDGKAGLKIYNASDVNNLQLISIIENMETFDVIAFKGIALVVAKGGLYQYDYTNPAKPVLLSKMEVAQ